MGKKLVFAFGFALSAMCAFAENVNLLSNYEFKSKNGKTPDLWLVSQAKPAENIFTITSDGKTNILEIGETSEAFVNSIAQRLEVDGFSSFKVEADIRLENIFRNAAIIYYWLDEHGKFIDGEKYVFLARGGSEWKRVEKIIAPDRPLITKGLALYVSVYGNTDGNGKALFKNLSVSIASESNNTRSTNVAKQTQGLRRHSFRDNFTAKPAGEPYHVSRNDVGFLDFCATPFYVGNTNVTVKVPNGVEIELYMFYPPRQQCVKIEPRKESFAKPDEKNYFYHITKDYHWLCWGNGLFFKVGKTPPDKFNIELEFETEDSKFDVKIPVIVLARDIPTQLPKNFSCYSYYNFPLSRTGLQGQLPNELFNKWQSAGFIGGWGNIDGADHWKLFWELHGVLPYRIQDAPPASREFLAPAITASGSKGSLICPSMLIENGVAFFIQCLKDKNMEDKIKLPDALVQIDYEPYVDGWTTAMCFCPKCIENFILFAKPGSHSLTPREILTRYKEKWVEFRCVQNSQVIKAMADTVHQLNPSAKFMFCSMPQAAEGEEEDYLERYGIDLTLYESFVDIHTPMIYNKDLLFFRRLESCFKNLTKPIMPTLSSGWGAASSYEPERYMLHLLASAMLGAKGAAVYSGAFQMDDAFLKAQRKIMGQIAIIETPYLTRGKIDRTTFEIIPQFKAEGNLYYVARSTNSDEYLILLCNNNEKENIFANIKSGFIKNDVYVRDIISNSLIKTTEERKSITSDELAAGISVAIPPLDYLLLEIGRSPFEAHCHEPRIIVSETAAMESKAQAKFDSMLQLRNESGFKVGTIEKNGELFYLIESDKNKLEVSLRNSAVASWQVRQNGIFNTVVEQAAIDIFMSPRQYVAKNIKAEFKNIRIKDSAAKATFSFSIEQAPFDGLRVEKTYCVDKNKSELRVKTVVSPERGYRQFVYRVNNILGIANTDDIRYEVAGGGKADIANPGALAFVKAHKKAFMEKHASKVTIFDGVWCAAENCRNGDTVKAFFDSRVNELFFWRDDSTTATMEWIYDNPYKDNDPHKADSWEVNYSLEYLSGVSTKNRRSH